MSDKDLMYWKDVKKDLNIEVTKADLLEALIRSDIYKTIHSFELTEEKIANLTGFKQPAVNRFFNSDMSPHLNTILKMLEPFGYTLKVVKISEQGKNHQEIDLEERP